MIKIQSMRGISVINLLVIAIVIATCSILVIHLLPPYLHYFAIKDAMQQIAADPMLPAMSKAKFKDLFQRKLQVNYITNVSPELLVLVKEDDKPVALSIKYEERVHLIANIDAVVMFEEEVKVGEKT